MDFRIEAPLLLKTRKSVKEYFENFANEKKITADGAFIWIFLCLSPLIDCVNWGSGRDEEQSREKFSARFRSVLMMHVHVLQVYWTLVVRVY